MLLALVIVCFLTPPLLVVWIRRHSLSWAPGVVLLLFGGVVLVLGPRLLTAEPFAAWLVQWLGAIIALDGVVCLVVAVALLEPRARRARWAGAPPSRVRPQPLPVATVLRSQSGSSWRNAK